MREALTSLLRSNGFRAEAFASADEFLNFAGRNQTSCLILDVRMPGCNGVELQWRLKSENCLVPIVFIAAHGDQKMREEVIRRGAVDLLSKPFSEESLLSAIQAALEKAA